MPPKAHTITDSELEIMKILWTDGLSNVKEICDKIYSERTASNMATIQKLLQRLEKKGMVRRNRENFVHMFEAGVSRGDILGEELQTLAETMLEGSLVPVLTQLLKQRKLSLSERREIIQLLEAEQN